MDTCKIWGTHTLLEFKKSPHNVRKSMVKGTQVSSLFQCVWAKYSPSIIYVKLYQLQRETAK